MKQSVEGSSLWVLNDCAGTFLLWPSEIQISQTRTVLNAAFYYSLLQADMSTEVGHKVWHSCLTLPSAGVVMCIYISGCFKIS